MSNNRPYVHLLNSLNSHVGENHVELRQNIAEIGDRFMGRIEGGVHLLKIKCCQQFA